jgi:hypothetical protein
VKKQGLVPRRFPSRTDSRIAFFGQNEMLLDQEIAWLQSGDMSIEGNQEIMNLNAPHPFMPTGTRRKLYKGRKIDLLRRQLLGLPWEDPET